MRKLLYTLIILIIIACLAGSASALFLYLLEFVTNLREEHTQFIYFLPLAGLIMGYAYYKYPQTVKFYNAQEQISFLSAPLIFSNTLLSHLVGASVGREGTAVQIGAAIADQFSRVFKSIELDRRALIIIGISAGFASVFGTPLAASVFALEVLHTKKFNISFFFYSILAAYLAHYVCLAWGISHTSYNIPFLPSFSLMSVIWCISAGIIFGLIAYLFTSFSLYFTKISYYLKLSYLRPFIAGIVLILLYTFFDLKQYMGLGLSSISASFNEQMQVHDFLIKILLTTFCIGFGFKGGEVTPLFFIGATLGNVLIWFIPLPQSLLAGMGLVAVFAAATNTPIASVLLAIELFGISATPWMAIACLSAYCISSAKSIYH